MFRNQPKCIECDNEIKGDDVVYIKMRYPKRRGVAEVKAYLRNEGQFICEACFRKRV